MTKPKAKSKVKTTAPAAPVPDVRELQDIFDATPAVEVTGDALVPNAPVARGAQRQSIGVVLTCHTDYLPYLRRAVEAIENQARPPDEYVVCLDGCEAPPWLRAKPQWYIVRGDYGNPNPMRNLGVQATNSDWLVFADADDAMHRGYLAGIQAVIQGCGPQVGIVNADIHTPTGDLQTPAQTDYWALRRRNYVSSAAGWRRAALEEAGGWRATQQYDDWTLALHVTALGYQTRRNSIPINVRVHPQQKHRTDNSDFRSHMWQRSFGVAVVLSGRQDHLVSLGCFLSQQPSPWPEATTLYLLNAAGVRASAFNRQAQSLAQQMLDHFRAVSYIQAGDPCCPYASADDRGRHSRGLANRLLPLVNEDMVLTISEDISAPAGSIDQLLSDYRYDADVAVLGAACRNTADDGTVEAWRANGEPVYSESLLESGCLQMEAVDSGLTLWNNGYVRPCLPLRGEHWEYALCQDIAGMGGTVRLDCGVRCQRIGAR
jgi:hypothetical protein